MSSPKTALTGGPKPDVSVEADLACPTARAICAVVVTYHPDSDRFRRIERVIPQVGQIVIVDNRSSASCVDQLKEIADKLGVHLILNSANEGLARAINRGAQWAAFQKYQWMLMLDQDTTVAPDMVETLIEVVRREPDIQRLALVGSNFKDKVTGRLDTHVARPDDSAGIETVTAITSGSLVSLSAFRAIGGLRDDFFHRLRGSRVLSPGARARLPRDDHFQTHHGTSDWKFYLPSLAGQNCAYHEPSSVAAIFHVAKFIDSCQRIRKKRATIYLRVFSGLD